MKNLLASLLLLCNGFISTAQISKEDAEIIGKVLFDNKDTLSKVLVFNSTLDGKNYIYYHTQTTHPLLKIMKLSFQKLDSMEIKISPKDSLELHNKADTIKSKGLPSFDYAINIGTASNKYEALLPIFMADEGLEKWQYKAMAKQAIEQIKQNVPIEEQLILQISQPLYFNKKNEALIFLLKIEPGTYSFFLCHYYKKTGKWIKKSHPVLLFSEAF